MNHRGAASPTDRAPSHGMAAADPSATELLNHTVQTSNGGYHLAAAGDTVAGVLVGAELAHLQHKAEDPRPADRDCTVPLKKRARVVAAGPRIFSELKQVESGTPVTVPACADALSMSSGSPPNSPRHVEPSTGESHESGAASAARRRPRPPDSELRRNCDSCVKKKIKCNGQQPCYMCERKQLVCKFSAKQKPGPKVRSSNFKSPPQALPWYGPAPPIALPPVMWPPHSMLMHSWPPASSAPGSGKSDAASGAAGSPAPPSSPSPKPGGPDAVKMGAVTDVAAVPRSLQGQRGVHPPSPDRATMALLAMRHDRSGDYEEGEEGQMAGLEPGLPAFTPILPGFNALMAAVTVPGLQRPLKVEDLQCANVVQYQQPPDIPAIAPLGSPGPQHVEPDAGDSPAVRKSGRARRPTTKVC